MERHRGGHRRWSVPSRGCDQYPDEMPTYVRLIVAWSATVQAELRANGEPRARCAARYDSTSKDDASPALRDAYASFFLTGKGQFWGSAFHVERFIDAVKEAAVKVSANHNRTLLVDVGAAPYNTLGGDISHTLTFAKHWPSSSGATIMGFEPGQHPFNRLVMSVEDQVGIKATKTPKSASPPHLQALGRASQGASTAGAYGTVDAMGKKVEPTTAVIEAGGREWIVLRNAPVSDRQRSVIISNQPQAGDNTASLEPHYQSGSNHRTVRSLTLDAELRRRGLSQHEILILKVDVEGHEMSVLQGAATAIEERRAPFILVEYGDKMSPAIWDAMKRPFSAAAAAPSSAAMPGPSLHSLQKWGDERGYDSFLLGAQGARPVLIGVTGALWREEYEVCRDKNQKFSNDGRMWKNFSAWNPRWEAVCWYDVALILREPRNPQLRSALLERSALPTHFCRTLKSGWYPTWIDEKQPPNLCCAHEVQFPERGEVCHTLKSCDAPPLVPRIFHDRISSKRNGAASLGTRIKRMLSQTKQTASSELPVRVR